MNQTNTSRAVSRLSDLRRRSIDRRVSAPNPEKKEIRSIRCIPIAFGKPIAIP